MAFQLKFLTDLTSPFLLIAGIIRLEHYGLTLCAIFAIAIERSFATYYVLDYEKTDRLWVGNICFIAALSYTQLFVIPVTFFQAPVIYIICYACLSTMVAKMILLYLYYYNNRELKKLNCQFKRSLPMRNAKYSISKKFQLEENIKITGYLRMIGLMLVVLVIVVLIFIVTPILYFGVDTYGGQIMMSLFDVDLAIGAVLFPAICLNAIRKTKKLPLPAKLEWINLKRRESKRIVPINLGPDESKVYFDQLHKSWE